MNAKTLGEFIIEARQRKEMSARQLAIALDISPVYMCDFEKNRRPVTDDILEKMRWVLMLSEEEAEQMYDLAAVAKNTVSADLPKYIMENELVRTALRTAKKNQVPDEKWEKFIREVIRKE